MKLSSPRGVSSVLGRGRPRDEEWSAGAWSSAAHLAPRGLERRAPFDGGRVPLCADRDVRAAVASASLSRASSCERSSPSVGSPGGAATSARRDAQDTLELTALLAHERGSLE